MSWLPLRGRWLGYALWGLTGFFGTQVTTRWAIVCYLPAVVVGVLLCWVFHRKGDWHVLAAFLAGFTASLLLTHHLFLEAFKDF
jgi:hypothetical protein